MRFDTYDMPGAGFAYYAANHPGRAPIYTSREAWLNALAARFAPWFTAQGHTLPQVRLGIGFPSSGRGSNTIGECWSGLAAADGVPEIWIAPQYGRGDERRVADILLHELIHATLGTAAGHGPEFKKLAVALGLTGQMTATVASPELNVRLDAVLDAIGPLPHGAHKLNNGGTGEFPWIGVPLPTPRCPKPGKPKQTTRLVKCICGDCGYTVRTTRLWIEKSGYPICPENSIPMLEPGAEA